MKASLSRFISSGSVPGPCRKRLHTGRGQPQGRVRVQGQGGGACLPSVALAPAGRCRGPAGSGGGQQETKGRAREQGRVRVQGEAEARPLRLRLAGFPPTSKYRSINSSMYWNDCLTDRIYFTNSSPVAPQHLLAAVPSQHQEGVRGKHDGAVGQGGVRNHKVLRAGHRGAGRTGGRRDGGCAPATPAASAAQHPRAARHSQPEEGLPRQRHGWPRPRHRRHG